MKKNMKKIFISTILITFIAIFFNMTVMAEDGYSTQMKALISKSEEVVDAGSATTTTRSVIGTVIGVAKIVGICVAVVMLLAVAMKYMSAAPGEKADIKKSAVIYVVGAIVLFAVTGILTLIEQFASVIKV